MLLNGVLVPLEGQGDLAFAADGVSMTVTPLGADADWRSDAELVFALQDVPTVGYRGFWSCD
ncbi:hypothetical protein [Wenxinia marina]|uniref:Wenxma_12, whole genome shotgun sequence n=1 Tax=Wenxinia marina DSM 24838 TaxID=1123501 RepID=A0A0D0PB06_9RHOB|nr:hypothetical protein [Wenxinia marina]KIQ68621.1 hypothetical protein Wenmar_02892 [Wenxinia marina DSM 24838]GGL67368.1 hypothetical protein GCM10011392_22360 [Wenxinia marina]